MLIEKFGREIFVSFFCWRAIAASLKVKVLSLSVSLSFR